MRSLRLGGGLLFGLVWVTLLLGGGCGRPSAKEQALEAGCGFLARIQRADGAICDTVNPLFDVWETALAAKALFAVRQDTADPALQRALAFLRANENTAGLVCHNQKCRASYCLETSAIYLELLADIDGDASIANRLDTILSLQKPHGAWEIGNPDVMDRTNFPSVTGFVWGLLQAHSTAQANDSTYPWLLAQQNAEGNWGKTWEYYNLPGYALWPILGALSHHNPAIAQAPLEKATHYIVSTQQADGSWSASDPAFPKMPSTELHTALMVAALQAGDLPSGNEAIAHGTAYLLAHQRPDGSWDGGYFPIANARYVKQEYVFASALALLALNPEIQNP